MKQAAIIIFTLFFLASNNLLAQPGYQFVEIDYCANYIKEKNYKACYDRVMTSNSQMMNLYGNRRTLAETPTSKNRKCYAQFDFIKEFNFLIANIDKLNEFNTYGDVLFSLKHMRAMHLWTKNKKEKAIAELNQLLKMDSLQYWQHGRESVYNTLINYYSKDENYQELKKVLKGKDSIVRIGKSLSEYYFNHQPQYSYHQLYDIYMKERDTASMTVMLRKAIDEYNTIMSNDSIKFSKINSSGIYSWHNLWEQRLGFAILLLQYKGMTVHELETYLLKNCEKRIIQNANNKTALYAIANYYMYLANDAAPDVNRNSNNVANINASVAINYMSAAIKLENDDNTWDYHFYYKDSALLPAYAQSALQGLRRIIAVRKLLLQPRNEKLIAQLKNEFDSLSINEKQEPNTEWAIMIFGMKVWGDISWTDQYFEKILSNYMNEPFFNQYRLLYYMLKYQNNKPTEYPMVLKELSNMDKNNICIF